MSIFPGNLFGRPGRGKFGGGKDEEEFMFLGGKASFGKPGGKWPFEKGGLEKGASFGFEKGSSFEKGFFERGFAPKGKFGKDFMGYGKGTTRFVLSSTEILSLYGKLTTCLDGIKCCPSTSE